MNNKILNRLSNYTLNEYIEDLTNLGLKQTWDYICEYVLSKGENDQFLNIANFGEMYEIGLAVQDKLQKKKSGQYYTPDDIASVMGGWFDECKEDNICDVACGTGKLILTYLNLIGEKQAKELLNNGKIFLYDFDQTALKICKTALIVKYDIKDHKVIHDIYCDFLDKKVHLPENARVISNPPYAGIDKFSESWDVTPVLSDTKELYSAFMEKIFKEAKSTVIITPFSFISGNKFFSLRKQMCSEGYGFIVAFDNVPGNIFCGRKHGVFNTNTANSVRAAITVMHQSKDKHGYKVTQLIRFKNEERERLLKCKLLENNLCDEYQIVDDKNTDFRKVQKELEPLYKAWINKSCLQVCDYLRKENTGFFIDMPNTCRYYTVGSCRKLSRTGSLQLNLVSEDALNFLYCLINSSFAYWWWRIYDGGITYPSGLLSIMPFPIDSLSEDDFKFFANVRKEMCDVESKYIISKVNAGVAQENIKFPETYRNKINKRIVSILGIKYEKGMFDKVHSNVFFDGNDGENSSRPKLQINFSKK